MGDFEVFLEPSPIRVALARQPWRSSAVEDFEVALVEEKGEAESSAAFESSRCLELA